MDLIYHLNQVQICIDAHSMFDRRPHLLSSLSVMTIDFTFSGFATKLWLDFQGFFLLVYGLLALLFSCKTGLKKSPNNGNNNSGTN